MPSYFRFLDCLRDPDPAKALANMLDRKGQADEAAENRLAATAALNAPFFLDPVAGIKGLFPFPGRSQSPLSIGTLVFVQRPQNVEVADALDGNPAAGVIVKKLSALEFLWCPLAIMQVFVQGVESDNPVPNSTQIYLGAAGNSAFGPPSASGSVYQPVGYRWYFVPETHRHFALIMPGGVRLSL